MMILVLLAALVGAVYGGDNRTCGCMQGPLGRDGRDGVPGPPGPSSPIVVELQELKKSLITELKQMVSIQYVQYACTSTHILRNSTHSKI